MISQKRYVAITSGVGGAATVSTRQFTLRLITQNSAIQTGTVYSYSDADDVMAVFGSSSEEYARAAMYFAFINKSISAPASISFVRWNTTDSAPAVAGDTTAKSLASLQAVTAGELNFLVNDVAAQVTGINLSAATSLTNAATLIQTAVRANASAMLASATVTYNTNTNQFTITGGVPGAGTLVVNATSDAADMASLLGWVTTTTTAGLAAQEPVDAISSSAESNNNFGSFVFCTPAVALTVDQMVAVASWNASQNVMYMYSFSTPSANAATLYAALKGYAGTAMNISADTADSTYIDQAPCEIMASIDYTAANATQNFMFYEFANRDVAVNSDTLANSMDAVRGNYNGQTQAAGNKLAFYQRGVLMGGTTDPVDMNTYINEMWMKDYISSQYLTALLALPEVSANTDGQAAMISVLQGAIDQAKYNGTISAGKTLTTIQQLYITQISGDKMAWRQVATNGYWYNVQILSRTNTNSGLTEYYAKYLLIYGKDDAIRFVQGTDTLI